MRKDSFQNNLKFLGIVLALNQIAAFANIFKSPSSKTTTLFCSQQLRTCPFFSEHDLFHLKFFVDYPEDVKH